MAGGSLRDRVNADRAALADLRKGLDTTVLPVVRPPSDAGMVEGLRPPVAREPTPEPPAAVRTSTPAPPAARPATPVPEPVPEARPPTETDLDSRPTAIFSPPSAPPRSVIVDGSLFDGSRTPPAARDEPTIAGPRGFSQRRRPPVSPPAPVAPVEEPPVRAPVDDAPAPVRTPPPVAAPAALDRFSMDDPHVPPGHAEPDWVELPTMVSVPEPPAPRIVSKSLPVIPFGLPGTSRKVVDSCMLQYVRSRGDEYDFVLTNSLTRRENITLRVGDAPVTVNVKTKFGDATLEFSLDSVTEGTKRVSVTMKASEKNIFDLERSAKHFKAAEFWANLKIKPFVPEIALTVAFAAVDLGLVVTGLGSDLLGAFQPIAVAGLAAVQAGLVVWSGTHRNTNLNKEAKTREVR